MKNETGIRDHLKKLVMSNNMLYNFTMMALRRKPVMGGLIRRVHGGNNRIVTAPTAIFIDSAFDIVGDNNQIEISDFCSFRNVKFLIRGDNNRITLDGNVRFNFGGSLHMEDNNCVIQIGRHSTFEDVHIAVTESGSRISIGEDCMFAYDIDIRTGDSHSIIDTTTNKRINYAGNVRIGNHVWIAPHCTILKGVDIKDNSVVATRTVISKSFDQEGIIIGGNPPRILKENITWDRKRIIDR